MVKSSRKAATTRAMAARRTNPKNYDAGAASGFA
jgi:hypothetical protein